MKLKHISTLALSLILAFTLAVPAFAENNAPTAQTREEQALAAVQAAMTYGGATAAQYAVWEDGKITISGSTGIYSKTENRALADTDLYGIGSVSKVYTAAAMMKLAEQGKVDLDKPVTKYLPEFKMADDRYQDITVRMLLNHSSGLMGSSTRGSFLFADTDQEATDDLLNRLATQRLKADPGEIAVYCNDGFTLAELVIEAVSGKDFGAFIHENLLTPLGLNSTFVPQDDFDTSRLVKTYASPTENRPLAQEVLGIVGTGGIYASASDLAAFGGAFTGNEMLSSQSITAMANAEYKRGIWAKDDADLVAYGLGWDSVKVYPFALDGVQALNKGGDTIYYHASLVVIPEYKMAAAVLSSGGVSLYNGMAANQMLLAALKDKGVSITETAPASPESAPAAANAGLTDLSGYYAALSQQMEVTITEDGKMRLRSLTFPSTPVQEFQYHEDGSFRNETGSAALQIVTEKNGVTYLYQKAWSQIPGLGLMPTSQYIAQKVSENRLTDDVKSVWDTITKLDAVPVNMKYSSQAYMSLLTADATATAGGMPELIPGYLGAMRIIDAHTARNELRIPNMSGRDSQDMSVYEENGVMCYTITEGTVFADAAKVTESLYAGPGAYATIGENGWARWYKVEGMAAGKKMTVKVPENAGFYVYNADGTVASSSVAYGDTTAVLSEGGTIVFAGEPGSRFYLDFTA